MIVLFVKDALPFLADTTLLNLEQLSTLNTPLSSLQNETFINFFSSSTDNTDLLTTIQTTPKSSKHRNDFDLSFLDDPSIVYGNDPKYLNEDGVDERLLFKYTLPKAKLYYPEPFIASPSYIHSDLIFLNILQY